MAASRSAVTPALTYRDPRAALAWLEAAFSFQVAMLIEGPDGAVEHAEVAHGDSLLMVGREWTDDHRSPESIGGRNTQTVHIHVEADIDGHCARARAAGAEILMTPQDQFYGDRTYRCRDPEGHIWTVSQTIGSVSREEAEAVSGLKITGWV